MPGEKWRRYAGVTAFTGMPGSGKSYGLAEMGYRALRAGMKVYSNAGFEVKGSTVLSSFEDFCSVEGPALILWDELPLFFNARKWYEFPDGLLYKFSQIRKDSLRLAYSALDEGMVDVNVRRVTYWYWRCFQTAIPGLMYRTLWPPKEVRRANSRPHAREFVIVRKRVTALYDTMAKVAVQASVAERISAVDGSRFVRPTAAAGGGPSAVVPAKRAPAGRGQPPSSGPVVGVVGADPWGLPVDDGSVVLAADEAPVGWDRGSWGPRC